MARSPITITVRDPNTGKPIRGAVATFKIRDTATSAPVYVAETGNELANLVSSYTGDLIGFMEPGKYRASISATGYVIRPYDFDLFESDPVVTDVELSTALAPMIAHVASVSNPHNTTKSQIGLGNVDNTADSAKPISAAAQAALDAHANNVANPHGVTKTQVGLGSVDNTSDASKPISAAAQIALNTKATQADLTTHNSSNVAHADIRTQLLSVESAQVDEAADRAAADNALSDQIAAIPAGPPGSISAFSGDLVVVDAGKGMRATNPAGTVFKRWRLGDTGFGQEDFINNPLVVPGLASWHKPESLALANGAAVATWPDSSANGKDFTQPTSGSRPTYAAAAKNGRGAVAFNGSAQQLLSTIALGQPCTLLIALKMNALSANDRVFKGALNFLLQQAGGVWQINSAATLTSTSAADLAWHVFCVVFNSANTLSRLYIDGNPTSLVGGNSGANNCTALVLASIASNMHFGELITVAGDLSSGYRDGLTLWMRESWAI